MRYLGVSSIDLANVFTVRQADVRAYVGTLGAEKVARGCEALAIAVAASDRASSRT